MIAITFKMDPVLLLQIEAIAIQRNVTIGTIMREAIERVLKEGKVPKTATSTDCSRSFSFKLDGEMLRELERIAMKYNMTRSEVIRRALTSYVKEYEKRVNYPRARVEVLTL
jgi:predicted transcriptional regulator|uniref:Ribbon-helix-helix protein, CopG family n=1 Tax=Candidatus Aramenus sulfurataquae TaxID=1326980 RepID=A0AAE3K2L4_9CREN|nr:ribbon-helix-helix protein, CopG family [Candidatus Aramenus sulfurataquae]